MASTGDPVADGLTSVTFTNKSLGAVRKHRHIFLPDNRWWKPKRHNWSSPAACHGVCVGICFVCQFPSCHSTSCVILTLGWRTDLCPCKLRRSSLQEQRRSGPWLLVVLPGHVSPDGTSTSPAALSSPRIYCFSILIRWFRSWTDFSCFCIFFMYPFSHHCS